MSRRSVAAADNTDTTAELPRNQLLVGDARQRLRQLPKASIDCVITSPPYFRLRDYAVPGQLGLEAHVDDWVAGLRAVAADIERVLTPTGSLWLNLGDSYAAHRREGAAPKSLLLGPERLALALVADGWLLRNKLIWHKTNPMPTSVRDRLASSYEVIYLFVRSPQYFFDLDAVRRPHTSRAKPRTVIADRRQWRGPNSGLVTGLDRLHAAGISGHPLGKNPGDVLTLSTSGYRGAHHATFPLALAEFLVRAGCPERRCPGCRAPHRRRVIRGLGSTAVRGRLEPSCACPNQGSEPGLVLDPFFGAGTTALAAERLHRDWLGIELNPDFAALADTRLASARQQAEQAA